MSEGRQRSALNSLQNGGVHADLPVRLCPADRVNIAACGHWRLGDFALHPDDLRILCVHEHVTAAKERLLAKVVEVSYALTPRVEVFTELQNLTDTILRQYIGGRDDWYTNYERLKPSYYVGIPARW